jgi:hypothetical protein
VTKVLNEKEIEMQTEARQKAVAELVRNNPDEMERYFLKYLHQLREGKKGDSKNG